jgi:hypothetical protein
MASTRVESQDLEKGVPDLEQNPLELLNNFAKDVAADNQQNIIRNMWQLMYRYKTGIVPSIVIAYELLPYIPLPYRQMVGFSTMNVCVHLCDTMDTLFKKEDPLACIRISGKGNRLLGLGKETAKFVTALVPPALVGLGLGLGLMAYGKDILDSGNPAVQAVGLLLASSLVHVPITGLISWGLHGGTKTILDEVVGTPHIPEKKKPKLTPVQNVGDVLARPIQPTLMYEVLRRILLARNTEAALHSPYLSLTVLGFDQFFKCWHYSATVPDPIENLVPEEKKLIVDDGYKHFDDDGNQVALTVTPVQAKWEVASQYSLRMMVVLAAGFLINLGFSKLNNNREELTIEERLLYHTVLILASSFIEYIFDGFAGVIERCKNREPDLRPTLFNPRVFAPLTSVIVEEVSDYVETTPLVPK